MHMSGTTRDEDTPSLKDSYGAHARLIKDSYGAQAGFGKRQLRRARPASLKKVATARRPGFGKKELRRGTPGLEAAPTGGLAATRSRK